MTERQIKLWLTPEAEQNLIHSAVPEGQAGACGCDAHGAVAGIRRQPDVHRPVVGRGCRPDVSPLALTDDGGGRSRLAITPHPPHHKRNNRANMTMWQPSQRYPDPAVQVLHASFNRYRLPLASVERSPQAAAGRRARYISVMAAIVLWSDIPNDRILKWEEETGAVSMFRKSSNNANGNTRDRQGRLVTCEHTRPPRHPHRIRRRHHRAGRQLSRQARSTRRTTWW